MNKLTLNAAVKRYGNLTGEVEIKNALAKDDKKFSGEEIDDIYAAIVLSQKSFNQTKPENAKIVVSINEGLGLENIDYGNFMPNISRDEDDEGIIKATTDFLKYRDIEKNLVWNKHYQFDCIRARGQFRKKANGDLVLVGIKIISNIPKYTTITEYRHIKDLNAQILNPDNPESNSVFYLLKK